MTVKAPMPGKILEVCVKEGDKVATGDVLFILEAMKMEIEIPAPEGGTVSAIKVSEGAQVETDSDLVVVE